MANVSYEQFKEIQRLEEEWWRGNAGPGLYDHTVGGWGIYDQHFRPYYLPQYRAVADVGCGPIPHICDPLIVAQERIGIDPLIDKYMKVNYFQTYLKQLNAWFRDIAEAPGGFFDGVFCENTMDHCYEPEETLNELYRIAAPGGRLYFYVDVDKPPDQLHPHRLASATLVESLSGLFKPLLCEIKPSWKFANPVLWFVGIR